MSEQVRKALLCWLPGLRKKVTVVPNAVDPGCFRVSAEEICRLRHQLDIDRRDRVVLYAGRLVPQKGPDVLLDALAHLSTEGTSIRVLIVGHGPLEETLRRKAVVSSHDQEVTFLGLRKDVPLLLNLADLVVLPSRWEGLPMILLEAMAACRPVIATAVGGILEVIEHGVTGWLVPPEDPLALAEAIGLLIRSPDLCERLTNKAFQRVCAHYSTEVTIGKLLDIYHNVLQVRV